MTDDMAERSGATSTRALALDEQLCFALYGASMAIGRLYKPMLDEWGVTYPQYLVLSALWERDHRSIGIVAERLGLEASTLTPMVRRLVAAGYVERERNPDDERQVVLRLTEAGAALRDESSCLAERLLSSSGLPITEIRQINTAVTRLRDAVAGAVRSRRDQGAGLPKR